MGDFIWIGKYPPDEWEHGSYASGNGNKRIHFATYTWRGKYVKLPWLEYVRENSVDRSGETDPREWRSRWNRFRLGLSIWLQDPIVRKRFFRRKRIIDRPL